MSGAIGRLYLVANEQLDTNVQPHFRSVVPLDCTGILGISYPTRWESGPHVLWDML